MIRSLILGGLMLFLTETNAQIWPGDIDDNGIANHLDLLYLGQAFGTTGPPRTGGTILWEEQSITTLWAESFPNGINYAYADCNGDGVIDYVDLNAIEVNFNQTQGVVTTEIFDTGILGVSPPLSFGISTSPIIEGTLALLPLTFGTESIPVNNFYSVAFTINYDPNIVEFNFFPFPDPYIIEGWLDTNNEPPLIIARMDELEGKIEIAVSRTDGMPLPSNFGDFGTLFIVIIDNVVGLGADQIATNIYIDDVKLLDELGMTTPVFADSTELIIHNDDLVGDSEKTLTNEVQIYPNPINEQLSIQSKNVVIEQIELFSMTGQRLVFLSDLSTHQLPILTEDYPSGVYQLNIQTSKGPLSKKVVIQH